MTPRRVAALVVGLAALAFCALVLLGLSSFALHERAMERCVSLNGGRGGAVTGPEMTWTGPAWACKDGSESAEETPISFWNLGPEDVLAPALLLLAAFLALPALVVRDARRRAVGSA
jgi:hypothetical protein